MLSFIVAGGGGDDGVQSYRTTVVAVAAVGTEKITQKYRNEELLCGGVSTTSLVSCRNRPVRIRLFLIKNLWPL